MYLAKKVGGACRIEVGNIAILYHSRGRCLGVKQTQRQRQGILSGYWLVVSSLNCWFLAQIDLRGRQRMWSTDT